MKLIGSKKKKTITKVKNGENVPHLEITEVLFVHCNLVSNTYQHDTWVLHIPIQNESFRILLDFPIRLCFPKEIWFEILINWSMVYWSKPSNTRGPRYNKINFSNQLILICQMQCKYIKRDIQLNLGIEDMLKAMNFYLLLRIMVKIYTMNMVKSFLIRQKNLLQILWRLYGKDQFRNSRSNWFNLINWWYYCG